MKKNGSGREKRRIKAAVERQLSTTCSPFDAVDMQISAGVVDQFKRNGNAVDSCVKCQIRIRNFKCFQDKRRRVIAPTAVAQAQWKKERRRRRRRRRPEDERPPPCLTSIQPIVNFDGIFFDDSTSVNATRRRHRRHRRHRRPKQNTAPHSPHVSFSNFKNQSDLLRSISI